MRLYVWILAIPDPWLPYVLAAKQAPFIPRWCQWCWPQNRPKSPSSNGSSHRVGVWNLPRCGGTQWQGGRLYIYISYHISYIFLGPNSFILPSDKMNLLGSPSCFDRFRTIDSIDVPYPRPPCARTLPGMPTPPWAQARTTQGAAAFEGWSSSQMALAVGGNIGRAVGIKILPVLHIYI
jgi:hypothetical protein